MVQRIYRRLVDAAGFQRGFQKVSLELTLTKLPPAFSGFRILHLSDLHNRSFGGDNGELIRWAVAQQPQLIVYTGDMVDRTFPRRRGWHQLMEGLEGVAPAYFILGNHEDDLSPDLQQRIKREALQFGIHILDNERVALQRQNQVLSLAGFHSPMQYLRNTYGGEKGSLQLSPRAMEELLGSSAKEFEILLAHNPLYFETYVAYGANLILSGHVHGGLVRLPGIGGLFSPDRTLFPPYSKGVYQKGNAVMVVSPGLGGPPLRLFNPPQAYVLTLRSQESQGGTPMTTATRKKSDDGETDP